MWNLLLLLTCCVAVYAAPAATPAAPCTTRSLDDLQDELLCLSRLVEKLAFAVAASDATETVIVANLDKKATAVINDAQTVGHAASIANGKDAKLAVVQDAKTGDYKVVDAAVAAKAPAGEAGARSAQVQGNRAVGTNADGSLTGDSIGLIVGCILGAALIAAVIIAFSVVRKRRTTLLDANSSTPLLQEKGWQVE